jgi:hypothetical protein
MFAQDRAAASGDHLTGHAGLLAAALLDYTLVSYILIAFVCLIGSRLLEIVSPHAVAGPASAQLVPFLRAGVLRSAVPLIAFFLAFLTCAGYAMSCFGIFVPHVLSGWSLAWLE